tara:strand:+ start:606 stop:860 length:255 start_codon:yes stop_codon:yes gene_type:complete
MYWMDEPGKAGAGKLTRGDAAEFRDLSSSKAFSNKWQPGKRKVSRTNTPTTRNEQHGRAEIPILKFLANASANIGERWRAPKTQ